MDTSAGAELRASSQYLYSKWHDYDYIYEMNDYIVEANICSEATQPFSYSTNNVGNDIILLTRSYAIDRKDYNTFTLSDCKEHILEANGVRF